VRRIAILAVCFGLFAAPALAQTKAAIQSLEDQWAAAFDKGDAAAVAGMYTQDAYVLPAGDAMVQGRAAIEALWKKEMGAVGDVKCATLDVKALGPGAAREIGTCTFKTKSQPPQEGALKYAVVWEKEGGRWKLSTDIWNTDK
jgi:uncharacterized protein (TIGR02246 family)